MAEDGALSTMAQAARLKGVAYHTVSRAVRRGKLPARRLGRQCLIAAADLDGWAPMYQRAPRKYRRAVSDPGASVAPVDTARLDRAALERQVSALASNLAARAPLLSLEELRALADGLAAAAAAASV